MYKAKFQKIEKQIKKVEEFCVLHLLILNNLLGTNKSQLKPNSTIQKV